MDKLKFDAGNGRLFTYLGKHIKTDEHYTHFQDRKEGLRKIPNERVIFLGEAD